MRALPAAAHGPPPPPLPAANRALPLGVAHDVVEHEHARPRTGRARPRRDTTAGKISATARSCAYTSTPRAGEPATSAKPSRSRRAAGGGARVLAHVICGRRRARLGHAARAPGARGGAAASDAARASRARTPPSRARRGRARGGRRGIASRRGFFARARIRAMLSNCRREHQKSAGAVARRRCTRWATLIQIDHTRFPANAT